MNKQEFYLNGAPLILGKRIGRGGEGEVYLAANHPRTAVKIYTGVRNADREEKVSAMVRHNLAGTSSLIAFPKAIVKSKGGTFAGFTMNVIEGHRPLHEVYGPKSRKTHYPKADFRFLIRTAMNVARAVGHVHQSPCIIGDVNHSGILVSENATVAIIDADSFQFEAGDKRFPCLVGVPDFTPPELQGASLNGIVRTKHHDHFGLGVALFQLLFMGRHPYAGQYVGADLALEQVIAKNLFAYSRLRKTGMAPPSFVANLNDFPLEVTDAFERAFGINPELRPNAGEWVDILKQLEGRLSRCSANPLHYFPSHGKNCPWCRMENAIGAILFVSPLIDAVASNSGYAEFNIDRVWAEIESIALPDPRTIQPRISAIPAAKPSDEARKTKSRIGFRKLFGGTLVLAAIAACYYMPGAFLIWLAVFALGRFQFKHSSADQQYWKNKCIKTYEAYESVVNKWQTQLGIYRLYEIKSGLKNAADEFRNLSQLKSQALGKLNTERQARQLHDHLDKFLIRNATIPGLAHGKTITLASFGIESAADVTRTAIINIPGFGDATADKLLAWRAYHEGHFIYDPAPSPADAQARSKIENEFTAKAKTLINRLSAGGAELRQAVTMVQARLSTKDPQLNFLAVEIARIETDLKFLNIAKPSRTPQKVMQPIILPRTVSNAPPRAQPPSPISNPPPANNTQCPKCGATMIKRVAGKGRNKGRSFWGCSRFPRCKGTRS